MIWYENEEEKERMGERRVRMAEEIAGNAKASEETFGSLARHLAPDRIAELVIAIGYYMMVSCFLETFEVEIEP